MFICYFFSRNNSVVASNSEQDHKSIDNLYSKIETLVGLFAGDDNHTRISASHAFFEFMNFAKAGHQNHENNNELTLVTFGHKDKAYVALIPKGSIQSVSLENYLEKNVLNDNDQLKVSSTSDAICVVNTGLDLCNMYTVDDAAKSCFRKTGAKLSPNKFSEFKRQTGVSISFNPAPIENSLFDNQVYEKLIQENILTSIGDNKCKLAIQKDLLESELQKLVGGDAGIDEDKSKEICNILKKSCKSPSINIQETLNFSKGVPALRELTSSPRPTTPHHCLHPTCIEGTQ